MTGKPESKDRDKVFELVVLKEKTETKKAPHNYEPLKLPAGPTRSGEYMVPEAKEKHVEPVSEFETSEKNILDNEYRAISENADSRRFAYVFGTVTLLSIVLFALLVISLSLAGYSYNRLGKIEADDIKTSNELIGELYRQLENVSLKLQQMQEMIEAQNDAVQAILNSTSVRVTAIDRSLRSSIASTTANFSLLGSTVSSLESNISSLQSRQDTINTTQSEQLAQTRMMFSSQISTITRDVANLTTTINSQVNFSQECHRESASCPLRIINSYFLECFTGFLPMNISVRI